MLGINIETNMRRKAFEHLQKLSFRFYDNKKTGHLITREPEPVWSTAISQAVKRV